MQTYVTAASQQLQLCEDYARVAVSLFAVLTGYYCHQNLLSNLGSQEQGLAWLSAEAGVAQLPKPQTACRQVQKWGGPPWSLQLVTQQLWCDPTQDVNIWDSHLVSALSKHMEQDGKGPSQCQEHCQVFETA